MPLCIDLFSGLGGWSEGFIAEGYSVVGFDIERHIYGDQKYPAQLVLQDVLTIHGSQFRTANCIVASPPCQNYSYLAMPWSRSKSEHSRKAKALRAKWETEGPDNRLFDACFRIQREAIEAAGRFIPLIVENVRGAQPWVGRSAWNYGSFHLWGDVPALMPINLKRGAKVPGFRFDGSGKSFQTASVEESGVKGNGGGWFHNAETGALNPSRNPREFLTGRAGGQEGVKAIGKPWFGREGGTGVTKVDGGWLVAQKEETGLKRPGIHISQGFNNWPKDENGQYEMPDGTKIGGDWFSDPQSTCRKHGSRSQARKAASAMIAKIPFDLSSHIARVYKPMERAA